MVVALASPPAGIVPEPPSKREINAASSGSGGRGEDLSARLSVLWPGSLSVRRSVLWAECLSARLSVLWAECLSARLSIL